MANVGVLLLIVLASITDIRSMRIPNKLTAASFAAALAAGFVLSGMQGIRQSLAGAAAGVIPMLIMYVLKGVGAGDVKLFAALGAWLGMHDVLELLLYSIVYAGAIGLLLSGMAWRLSWPRRLFAAEERQQSGEGTVIEAAGGRTVQRFPFMLAVAPAFATTWWIIG